MEGGEEKQNGNECWIKPHLKFSSDFSVFWANELPLLPKSDRVRFLCTQMHPIWSCIYLAHHSNPGIYHNLAWKRSSINIWWNNKETNELNPSPLAERPEVQIYIWDFSRSFSAEFLLVFLILYTLRDPNRSPSYLARAQIPGTGQSLVTFCSSPSS